MNKKLKELLNLTAIIKIKQSNVTWPYVVGPLTYFVNNTNRGGSTVKVWGVGE